MKCPYCGQEHPDNFQFCPVTGKKIEIIKESTSELIACTNPSCDDYGKHILPADSRFCPSCGEKIKDKEEYLNLLGQPGSTPHDFFNHPILNIVLYNKKELNILIQMEHMGNA